MRWIVHYKTVIGTGRADAIGETAEEAEAEYRARYRDDRVYTITKIEPLDAALATGRAI